MIHKQSIFSQVFYFFHVKQTFVDMAYKVVPFLLLYHLFQFNFFFFFQFKYTFTTVFLTDFIIIIILQLIKRRTLTRITLLEINFKAIKLKQNIIADLCLLIILKNHEFDPTNCKIKVLYKN